MNSDEKMTTSVGNNQSLQSVKDLVEYMQGRGVLEFTAMGITVKFGTLPMPEEVSFDPEVAKQAELDEIKRKLARINSEEDEILYHST